MRLLAWVLLLVCPVLALTTPDAFTKAVRKGDQKTVQAMLAQNPGLLNSREPKFGSPPLHTAVARHQVAIVKLLLDQGADINAGNDLKMTALHLCAQFDYRDLAQLLLDRQANPNARTKTGITPLRLAEANHNRGVADLIRSHGGTD